jgi:hypothetical protein
MIHSYGAHYLESVIAYLAARLEANRPEKTRWSGIEYMGLQDAMRICKAAAVLAQWAEKG